MPKLPWLVLLALVLAIVYRVHHYKRYTLYQLATRTSALFALSILAFMVCFVIIKGALSLKPEMFSLTYTTANSSMTPAILTTLATVVLAILLATPIGVGSAIFLVEYPSKQNRFVAAIRLATETLAGIPSIVYGLFGMLLFVSKLKMGFSILAGVCTVSIMILPIIMRATEEALRAVRKDIRQGSFALGAGKLRTILVVVLPSAIPGILSGIILSIGRVVGETAALMYTLGTSTSLPTSLNVSSRTLALHMYVLSSEGKHVGEAYATGMVLIVLVLIINYVSSKLAEQLGRLSRES